MSDYEDDVVRETEPVETKRKFKKRRKPSKLGTIEIDEQALDAKFRELREAEREKLKEKRKRKRSEGEADEEGDNENGKEGEDNEESQKRPKHGLCLKFIAGQAHDEEKCKFVHQIPEVGSAEHTEATERLAERKKQGCLKHSMGKCKRGEECMFSHNVEAPAEMLFEEVKQKEFNRLKAKEQRKDKKRLLSQAKHELLREEKKRLKQEFLESIPEEEREAFKTKRKEERKVRRKSKRKEEKDLALKQKALTPIEPELKKDRACMDFNLGKCVYTEISCEFTHRMWTPFERKTFNKRQERQRKRKATQKEVVAE